MNIIKQFVTGVFVVLFSLSTQALTIKVGGVDIEIPKPKSFSLVIPEMKELYEFEKLFIAPTNVSFATFIPDSDVGTALMNEVPESERTFGVETVIKMVDMSINNTSFESLRKGIKTINDEILRKVKEKTSFNELNSNLKDELELDLNISINEIIPLDVHFENERALSYSAFMKNGFDNEDGTTGSYISIITITVIHIKSKVLILFVDGAYDDLEWTREASTIWVKEIIKANSSN